MSGQVQAGGTPQDSLTGWRYFSVSKSPHKWKPSDNKKDCQVVDRLMQHPLFMEEWHWGHKELFECLRKQSAKPKDRVELAEKLAKHCGVQQVKIGKTYRFF
jgi:hypothetical protein